MLFNSLHFLLFFPCVVLGYFVCPARWRWAVLLAASWYFYMCWRVPYILLLLISTAVAYITGIYIETAHSRRRKRIYLLISLTVNLGILGVFKYGNFFIGSLSETSSALGMPLPLPSLSILLPVGISFYTFQVLSYTIDVYRGEIHAQRHPGIFALYVSFFPQLVAGPIERSTRLLPQLKKRFHFDEARVVAGMRQMLWGFFKKIVIADRVAVLVDHIYADPGSYTGWPLVLATYFFAVQIYCDFSAYSDIAIGGARIFGYRLMTNFSRPYFARSIPAFWRRWHISLSTWFRDYLYIPLGGSRVATKKWIRNILVVFVLSGLWHGAAWTFVVWGGLHGLVVLLCAASAPLRKRITRVTGLSHIPRLHAVWDILVTFHLSCAGWIFFRAATLEEAWYICTHLAAPATGMAHGLGLDPVQLGIAAGAIVLLFITECMERREFIWEQVARWPLWIRWSLYCALTLVILNLPAPRSAAFIYFQF